ncbi:MAG: hypothetical protein HY070_10535 [Chloroflexi bacterium]|nr:hypothetical protein [Chloroflexota bacterium]MBI3740377.1 hypothetical protein [Chloroflexota bacterium]
MNAGIIESENKFIVCTNISPRERMKRLRFGILALGVSLALVLTLLYFDAARAWRVALFVPFASAAIGFFQAHEKT